uniref:hypothetical protein n=1 Tax=Hydrocytium acuminatum TaxID=1745963 RepID=UPI002A822D9D|nr:hypothetical protein UYM18_pgp102 [Hydrocytium acuminatum]WOR09517.1 hypothetical protein [Hydrocytium acuminatum]
MIITVISAYIVLFQLSSTVTFILKALNQSEKETTPFDLNHIPDASDTKIPDGLLKDLNVNVFNSLLTRAYQNKDDFTIFGDEIFPPYFVPDSGPLVDKKSLAFLGGLSFSIFSKIFLTQSFFSYLLDIFGIKKVFILSPNVEILKNIESFGLDQKPGVKNVKYILTKQKLFPFFSNKAYCPSVFDAENLEEFLIALKQIKKSTSS